MRSVSGRAPGTLQAPSRDRARRTEKHSGPQFAALPQTILPTRAVRIAGTDLARKAWPQPARLERGSLGVLLPRVAARSADAPATGPASGRAGSGHGLRSPATARAAPAPRRRQSATGVRTREIS